MNALSPSKELEIFRLIVGLGCEMLALPNFGYVEMWGSFL